MASRASAIHWATSLIGVALIAAIVVPPPAQAAGPARSDPVAGSAADAGPPELRAAKPGTNRLNRQVSGPYAGTHVIVFEACGIVSQSYDLQYTAESGGSGSLVLEGCVADANENFAYHGDFTLTTPSGAVLRGTAEGTALPVDLTLNVTSSQGRHFRRVAGSIAMAGEWSGNPTGPASGTLVGALVRARR